MKAASTRVLLVDDDEDDYLIVKKLLQNIPHKPFSLDWEPDVAAAAVAIDKNQHDAYLIDYRLGAHTGLELLGRIDLIDRLQPFIILTGAGDETIERQAMDIGAADYLVKGTFDAELLSRVLRYSIQRKHLEALRIQQLVEINSSKDEFIALASHQLRTPATAVKQYLGMLLDEYAGPLTTAQTGFLKTAYSANERQLGIVNDILRVAQLDLKKIVLNPSQHDIRFLIDGIIEDLSPQLADRSQKLHYDRPNGPAPVLIDGEFFRMALNNIVDNASKYTPHGKAISIYVEQQAGGSTTIEVRDEGVGIAKDDMDKLFKKFSRIHNSLSVAVGGNGLGLYWAGEIIELHGGTIQVASGLDKGTTFLITLPPLKLAE